MPCFYTRNFRTEIFLHKHVPVSPMKLVRYLSRSLWVKIHETQNLLPVNPKILTEKEDYIALKHTICEYLSIRH